eukprot:5450823-Pleurochrysis_carterae.AAC.1
MILSLEFFGGADEGVHRRRLESRVPRVRNKGERGGIEQLLMQSPRRSWRADHVVPSMHDSHWQVRNLVDVIEQPAVVREEAAVPHVVQVDARLCDSLFVGARVLNATRPQRRDGVLPRAPRARSAHARGLVVRHDALAEGRHEVASLRCGHVRLQRCVLLRVDERRRLRDRKREGI